MVEETLKTALKEAEKLGVYIIGRFQNAKELAIIINNDRVERIVNEESVGLGVQAFTREGYCGFASVDNPNPKSARELVQKAAQLAELNRHYGGEKNTAVFGAEKFVTGVDAPKPYSYNQMDAGELTKLVRAENKYVLDRPGDLSVQTVYRQIIENWRIVRSDGSVARFDMPRAVLAHNITARREGRSITTRSAVGGTDIGILLDGQRQQESRSRAEGMAGLAVQLLTAPQVKGGHYKLVIDYALAKGLAHEAFGHAVETDGVRTSILAENGKLAIGTQVADSKVSIIDSPLAGDWAYQPVSANAIPRQSVTIVNKGRLAAGLGDLFSAAEAGVPVTGAGRAESYAQIPLARMTNIRIEVADPVPLDKPWYAVSPEELYRLLLENRLIAPGEEVYYLSGYKGGQVNTRLGDFVFNCTAIYRLGEDPVLYQPGIFAGKTLSAFKAIRAGIGDLVTDALGTCGKWGQGVSSSGGSHAFLLLDQAQDITIGGA